jgi:hypothetical protein
VSPLPWSCDSRLLAYAQERCGDLSGIRHAVGAEALTVEGDDDDHRIVSSVLKPLASSSARARSPSTDSSSSKSSSSAVMSHNGNIVGTVAGSQSCGFRAAPMIRPDCGE